MFSPMVFPPASWAPRLAASWLAILSEAERVIVEEDLPVVPIYQYVSLYEFDGAAGERVNPHPRSEQYLFLVDMLGDAKGADKARMMPARPRHSATAPQGHMATSESSGSGQGGAVPVGGR